MKVALVLLLCLLPCALRLILRPHSSGSRKPCIWTLSISLKEGVFEGFSDSNNHLLRRVGINSLQLATRSTVAQSDPHFFVVFPSLMSSSEAVQV